MLLFEGRMTRALLQVLRLAMADANLAANEVSGIEMHGTGTALGDPIEIGALMAVFEGKLLSIYYNVSLQDMQDVIMTRNCLDILLRHREALIQPDKQAAINFIEMSF